MKEDWYTKQERQLREHLEREADRIARETKRIRKAIGVTPERVSAIQTETTELPRGVVKFQRARVKRWRRVA